MKNNSKNDIKALKLASRFALPPNSLGYCGRNSAPEKFKRCFIRGNCEGVKEELSKFIVFNPYLQTIGKITGRDPFSYEVVESYCIGNDLLLEAKPEHYNLLLEYFAKQGVPSWFVKQLADEKPKKFYPNHLFQVLHVGVGRASGSVPFNIETINSCMVRWGEVEKKGDEVLMVELTGLIENGKKYKTNKVTQAIPYNPQFDTLKSGDLVAVHWNRVIKKLTDEESEKFNFWTNKIIRNITIQS